MGKDRTGICIRRAGNRKETSGDQYIQFGLKAGPPWKFIGEGKERKPEPGQLGSREVEREGS